MSAKVPRRGPPGVITILAAMLASMAFGYYAGSQFGSNRAPHSDSADSSTAVSTNPTAYYAEGTTVFGLPFKAKPVCLNTCKQAKNGKCDDGRREPGAAESKIEPWGGPVRMVTCDLGTDCDDCGPWTPSGHAPWISGSQPGPIARLMEQEIEVRARPVGMGLGFSFAYTDPKKDVDVSHHMETGGTVEGGITRIFRKIFNEKCDPAKNGGKRGLFVDVGANFGWFSVLAASMGCRVTAFEPVPHFHAFFEYSVHLNGLANLVDMRGNLISHVSGSKLKMVVPTRGIWGTAGIDGLNIDQAIMGSVNKEIEVPSMKLDELIKEDVLLLKVDVEGWEWSVMQGAAKLISTYNVENVIMEYSPGVPERSYRTKEMRATVQMLVNLADSGFRIAHIGDQNKHHAGGLDAPLPPSEEVTVHNLMYDLVDAELFAGMMLGCPVPPLLTNFSAWSRCQALPEDPSPRSLRSLIGHNTNIWAAKKGSKIQVLNGVVGILPLEAPYSQFFVNYDGKEIVFGMGSRLCKDLPPLVQVRHRCHCTDKAVCGAEEEAMDKAIAANSIASNYVLTSTGKLVSGEGFIKTLFAKIGTARKLGEPYLPGAVKGMLT